MANTRWGGTQGAGAGRTPLGDPRGCLPGTCLGPRRLKAAASEGHLPRRLKSPVSPGAAPNAFPGARLARKPDALMADRMIPPHPDRTPARVGERPAGLTGENVGSAVGAVPAH